MEHTTVGPVGSILLFSGALIAIPTYYWPSTHPTFSDLAFLPLYNNIGLSLSEPLQLYQKQSLDSSAGYMYTLWVQQDITDDDILATFRLHSGYFWLHFGYILATFWLHSGYILATFWVHSGYILATLWLYSGYILATIWVHTGYILATFWLHSGYILATFWLHSGYTLATFWLLFGYIMATLWLHSCYILATFGYILATFWLHSGYILAIFWLHFGYIDNCWRSVPLPCGQYMAIFFSWRMPFGWI